MNKEVDMTYRFTWNEDPSDEQLLQLMREVGEDVRQKKAEREARLRQRLREGYQEAKKMYDAKYGKA